MPRPQQQDNPIQLNGSTSTFPRASGVLLHPTCLPGRFGIGDLGQAAYQFIDFLADTRQQYWQILPLGPTGYGDSPYQALSAFAGNMLLINLEKLVEEHCLASWDFNNTSVFSEHRVNYGQVIDYKKRILRLSFENFKSDKSHAFRSEFVGFIEENHFWLDDYALFAALKDHHLGASWNTWEQGIMARQPAAIEFWRKTLEDSIAFHQFTQFLFFRQWAEIKKYANARGIRIIGDIPIFVAFDSADTWAQQELFYLDAQGKPTHVAGVPPDYFCSTGQLWGNPLYRWELMAEDGFQWWIARLRFVLKQADVLRLDHFRGFESFWAVPAGEETAVNGKWMKGPGKVLFQAIGQILGPVPIIAEDLGIITPQVEALRKELRFPGMKVLQFAFTGDPDHPYLPHNYEQDCVVYTGTHDNDTIVGWINSIGGADRKFLIQYLGGREQDSNWEMIRLAYMSIAHTAIVPLQDIFGLGSESRMNTPGQAGGNWQWRFSQEMLINAPDERLKELTELYGRAPSEGNK